MGRLSDFFRLAWGFLSWNTRKTVFRRLPLRNEWPCQHPCESRCAWETNCDKPIHRNYLPALQPRQLKVSYALFDHYAPVP